MANRYWAAGVTGNWNSTSSWSSTSDGLTVPASVPGSADAAIFNAASGTVTATLDISPTIVTLTCTGFTGTLAFGTNTITLTGTTTVFAGATTMSVSGTPLIILSNSATSGTRTINASAVTEANSISFNIINGSGTAAITVTGSGAVRDLNFTGFTGSLSSTSFTVYGSLTLGTGMSVAAAATLTFAATSGTKTITTNGVAVDKTVTFNGAGGTWQLAGDLIVGPSPSGVASTRTTTLTAGTLNLSSYTLTTGLFNSSNTNTRTLAFGTGKILLTGTSGTVFNINTTTGLTVSGTGRLVEANAGGAGTRSFGGGISLAESSAVNILVSSGSDIVAFSGTGGSFGNVSFVGFTGTLNIANNCIIYGNWTFGSGMASPAVTGTGVVTFSATSAKTITSNGKTFVTNTTFNGVGGSWQLQDNFGTNSTSTITLTNGTLDLNNFTATAGTISSSNSNTRVIAFGTSGKLVATYAVEGGSATVVNFATSTGFTYTGTSRIEVSGAPTSGTRSIAGPQSTTGGTEANSLNIYVTAGIDAISFGTVARYYGTLNFTGFGGVVANNALPQIFGDLVLAVTMAVQSPTGTSNAWSFRSTSGTTRNITTITAFGSLDVPIVFDGVGGSWALQDTLNMPYTTLTLTNGTLKLKSGTTNVVSSFVTTGTAQTYLQATTSGSQATISQASGTVTATFITIKDSNATGGAVWQASNAVNPVNAGNNSGWNFATAISGVSATGSVGTVNLGITPSALTGVQATGSVGTVYIGWRQINTTQTQTWTPVITS